MQELMADWIISGNGSSFRWISDTIKYKNHIVKNISRYDFSNARKKKNVDSLSLDILDIDVKCFEYLNQADLLGNSQVNLTLNGALDTDFYFKSVIINKSNFSLARDIYCDTLYYLYKTEPSEWRTTEIAKIHPKLYKRKSNYASCGTKQLRAVEQKRPPINSDIYYGLLYLYSMTHFDADQFMEKYGIMMISCPGKSCLINENHPMRSRFNNNINDLIFGNLSQTKSARKLAD